MEKTISIPKFSLSLQTQRILAQRARDVLLRRRPMGASELADALGLSRATVYRYLQKLASGTLDPKVTMGTALAILRAIAPEVLEELSSGLYLEVQDYVVPQEALGLLPPGANPPPPDRRFVRPQNPTGDLLALEEFPPTRETIRFLVVRRDLSPTPGQEVVVLRAGIDSYVLRRAPIGEGERLVGVVVERFFICRNCQAPQAP